MIVLKGSILVWSVRTTISVWRKTSHTKKEILFYAIFKIQYMINLEVCLFRPTIKMKFNCRSCTFMQRNSNCRVSDKGVFKILSKWIQNLITRLSLTWCNLVFNFPPSWGQTIQTNDEFTTNLIPYPTTMNLVWESNFLKKRN